MTVISLFPALSGAQKKEKDGRRKVSTSPFHNTNFASRLIRRSYKASANANQPSRKATASREAMARQESGNREEII
jgi:hypothetical protein